MGMLGFAATGASGFRAVCFALLAAASVSLAAPAEAGTIYTLTGTATGTRTQLNPNTHLVIPPGVTQLNGVGIELDFMGSGPAINFQGLALIVPVSSATFLPQGGNIADIILQPNTYFAIGIAGPYLGQAAFGIYDSSIPNFDGYLDFAGTGLNNYDGVSALAPVSVTLGDFAPFLTTRLGNLVEWNFSNVDGPTVTNAKFSAVAVPEPATLTLFGAGIAGVAAMRRRKTRK
jgi:hypothetical protein